MRRSNRLSLALAVLVVAALACNLPQAAPSAEPNAAFTAAALTVAAQLTQVAQTQSAPTSAGSLPPPTNTSLPTIAPPPPTIAPPPTLPPTPTQICDAAAFVTDVTVPDGTVFAPNTAFVKTWRLKNVGICSWTPSYTIVFDHGDQMSGPSAQALTSNVNPGQTVDLSVNLVSPAVNGSYKGYWKLRNPSGVTFTQFYADVKVAVLSSGFDLYTRAPDAAWIGGGGGGGGTILTFGGPDSDPNGFVMYRSGFLLEDGSSPSKILETHPKWVDDGVISGEYPAYTIVAGERFRAKIGFLAKADGTCGVGKVKFQLNYKEGGSLHPLGTWTKNCNGNLMTLDVDLSSLAGHSIRLVLAVLADGPASQDWAVWVAPRVVLP